MLGVVLALEELSSPALAIYKGHLCPGNTLPHLGLLLTQCCSERQQGEADKRACVCLAEVQRKLGWAKR